MLLTQVRSLKAALDTKQGNVSPDTLLALLEAANQEVHLSIINILILLLLSWRRLTRRWQSSIMNHSWPYFTLLTTLLYRMDGRCSFAFHFTQFNVSKPTQKKFDLLNECEPFFTTSPLLYRLKRRTHRWLLNIL